MSRRRRPDVELARRVAEHHRAELLARTRELADDPRFTSGAAWSVRALDRVLLVLDGETDPVKLGLERAPDLESADQGGLF